MIRTIVAIALAFGALGASPLPLQWPMYQFASNHQAVFAGPRHAANWHRWVGGKVNGGLALVGDTVFVESFEPAVYALDARTGAIRWKTTLPNVAMTAPIVAGGLVVVGTGSNAQLSQTTAQTIWGRPRGDVVAALSARTGKIAWEYPTVGEDMPTPALVSIDGTNAVVFANGDNHVRALRLSDGKLLWSVPTRGIATMSSAAVAGTSVYVIAGVPNPGGRWHDELYAVDARTGRYRWRAPVGNVDCSPAVDSGSVFVEGSGFDPSRPAATSTFNDVVAVDAQTGRMRWSWRSAYGHFTPVASHEQAIAGLAIGGVLYQSLPASSEFAAFDPAGHLRWKISTDRPVKMSAVLAGGKLYFGDTGSTLYVVDAVSGKVVGGRAFPSYFTVSPPVIAGRTLYVANDETVYAVPLSAL